MRYYGGEKFYIANAFTKHSKIASSGRTTIICWWKYDSCPRRRPNNVNMLEESWLLMKIAVSQTALARLSSLADMQDGWSPMFGPRDSCKHAHAKNKSPDETRPNEWDIMATGWQQEANVNPTKMDHSCTWATLIERYPCEKTAPPMRNKWTGCQPLDLSLTWFV